VKIVGLQQLPKVMKNRKSIYLIVAISLFVALLHFLIGPGYQGIFRHFIQGYLIDILLPFNIYLLLQISLRKHFTVFKSRIISASGTFLFGVFAEIMQWNHLHFLGETYDPLDILMYGIGVGIGVVLDLAIIDRLERSE
jgi:hypothetical protein